MKVQRRAPIDNLERDGETAVLLEVGIIRLSELSTVIYSLAEVPVELEHLARRLEAVFGTPAGQRTLDATKDAVAELIHHGVLIQVQDL